MGQTALMDERPLRLPLAVLLFLIAAGGALDLALDRPAPWLSFHTAYEVGLVLAAAVTASWLWSGWRRAEREGSALRRTLAERQAERDAWRADAERALADFSQAVNRQFSAWRLTPAERQVALALLRGKSHKEIASETGRSERTTRQHAASAYRKAGVDGRSGLAGFFLDSLRLPASGELEDTEESQHSVD
jgi:DNA-binding CsgD family transcriptional regulator